ncbi:MAG TPA: four helix bundle protein [Bacillota bacterium]|nr:four helix bundle protein [Bacillota bacterium]
MSQVKSYQDLIVWRKSMDLVEAIYQITNRLPNTEQWGLISQIRRAVISIPSNIAEGFGRLSPGEYKHFLLISRGSLMELETQLILCKRLGYINQIEMDNLLAKTEEVGKILITLIQKNRSS